MDKIRYPTGKFEYSEPVSENDLRYLIKDLRTLPDRLRQEVKNLDDSQLDTPYRDKGWTVRQVIHHLPDSHLNGYVRIKLALTEDEPTIKPYEQDPWARLPDNDLDTVYSLNILEGIHKRLVTLLESLSADEWNRTINHPENGSMTVKHMAALYAWHGNHHLAHITNLKSRKNW